MKIKNITHPFVLNRLRELGFQEKDPYISGTESALVWYGQDGKKGEGRRAPTIAILTRCEREDIAGKIVYQMCSSYYWRAVPDILLKLFKENLIEEET